MALAGDWRLAVSESADKTLKVWEVDSGAMIATFTCDGAAVQLLFAVIESGDHLTCVLQDALSAPRQKGAMPGA